MVRSFYQNIFQGQLFFLVVFVPPRPSFYTLVIDIVGFIMTLTSTILLVNFLNRRPAAQKYWLNRILLMFVCTMFFGTCRSITLIFLTSFFHEGLQEFHDTYPIFTASFIVMRFAALPQGTVVSFLSAGRLLLFVNPVLFQSLSPNTALFLASLGMLFIECLDIGTNWLTCYVQGISTPNQQHHKKFLHREQPHSFGSSDQLYEKPS